MKVTIGTQKVNLDEKDVLGSGGEALVLRYGTRAVKIYHNPTPERAKKLQAMTAARPNLPSQVIFPHELVYDAKNKEVIGFSMAALPDTLHPLAGLSNKNFRATHGVTLCQVANLFLRLHLTLQEIHRAGLIVGDFNDQNVLFEGTEATFIDVDSYQWGSYGCPVATEPFLDPALYGLDLSKQAYFQPQHDWYSYAVQLFRALLLAHPYGGTHAKVKGLTDRATQRLTVLSPDVNYPKIALSPNFLSDDLAGVFLNIFGGGGRGVFPLATLAEYANTLTDCQTCGANYPSSRKFCPACQALVAFVLPKIKSGAGIGAEELLAVSGVIVALAVYGEKVYCVVREENSAVLYVIERNAAPRRIQLFKWLPGASYAFMDGYLLVNPHATSNIMVFEVGQSACKPLFKTTSERYNGAAVLGAIAKYFYRIAGGMLLRCEIKYGQAVERPLTSVAEGQTWFTVHTAPDGDEIVTGFSRIFRDYEWFRVGKSGRETLALPPLEADEALTDFAVKPGGLILRQTRQQGNDFLRLDAANPALSQKRQLTPGELPNIGGSLYQNGVALWAEDAGMVKEALASRQRVELSATAPYLNGSSRLALSSSGILAATDNRVWRLSLS
jgi:hypothetical protein